ncbi:MAG: MATE family efflux transporter [Clostridia bacterium]|nr:MATE family efflux transporter [Clostridia bacterium]
MFTRDKEFYKIFIRLCLALMLEQAVVLSVNLADNLMLGTYNEAALAGVAAVNQIQFVYQQVVYSIGNGMIVLASQYWGQRRMGEIRSIACTGVRLELVVAALLFIAVSIFPEGAVRIFSPDDAIVEQGVAYLKIMRFSYPFFALTAVLLNAMRVVETVKIALGVSAISLTINCAINYLLIGGNLGAPELGVRGAAIGTLTARVVECIIVVCFVLRDKKLGLRLKDFLSRNGALVRDIIRVTLPVLFSGLLWGVANALQTVILGHMNDSAIAAQSISNTVFLLLKVTSVGAASAAAVIIGKTVGRGDLPKVKEYTRTLQGIFVCIGIVLATAMLLIRTPLLGVYAPKISEETYRLANAYMLIQSAVLLVMSYQMPINAGIIRGGGDTKFIMYIDIIAICTFIPLAMLGGMVWGWPPIAVIICVNVDQLLKCIPAAIHVNGYRWVKKLTR